MKKGFNILISLLCVFSIFSCSKTKSYTDYLNDEKKEIRRLISEKGFEILDKYPESGVFKENQFVILPNGVYLNVVDSGNGDRAILSQTKILCRLRAELFFNQDTPSIVDLFPSGEERPIQFIYGSAYSLAQSYMSYSTDGTLHNYKYAFLSPGLESAFAYVGDSSIVKMIIPFKSGAGSAYQMYYYEPFYYDKVRFIFDK